MLVMESSNINFQALADNIAGDFFANGVPLSDGVIKVAKERDFTPEEVKRLLEKTNTAASLRLLKTAENKKSTFALADLELVLASTHPEEGEPIEKAASVYAGIPNTRKKQELEKAASSVAPAEPEVEQPSFFGSIAALDQAIDELKMEKAALEMKAQSSLSTLGKKLLFAPPQKFQKLASECAAILETGVAKPVLDALAAHLNVKIEKTACDGVVDDRDPNIQAVSSICGNVKRIAQLNHEISTLASLRECLWDSAKKAAI